MEKLVLILHIVVCFFLIILVLLQAGKEGMGVIFGGGSSTLFGSTGAGGILSKLTTFMAILFIATSLSYTVLRSAKFNKEPSIIEIMQKNQQDPTKAPAAMESTTNATSE